MVRRHLVFLATFFVEPHPAATPLHKVILDPHGDGGAHAFESVSQERNQRTIAQAGKGSGVDRIEQRPGEHQRLTLLLRVLGPPHGIGGIGGLDPADHHPIEEHAQRGQPPLNCGFGALPELVFRKRRDVDRLALGDIHDAMLGTESGELAHRLEIRAAGIGIADARAKEVAHPFAGFGLHRKDGG